MNHDRLGEIFADVPTWPLSTGQAALKRAHWELVRLLSCPLQPVYPVVCVFSVDVYVRQRGELPRKEAVVALAVNLAGRLEVLGIWMGPHYKEFAHQSVLERGEALKNRRKEFWQGVVNNMRARGCRTIHACSRSLSLNLGLGSRELFEGLDEAIRRVYTQTLLLPRLGDLVHDCKAQPGPSKDLAGILREAGAEQARQALDRFVVTWGSNDEQYARIRDAWLKVWDPIVAIFGVPEAMRNLLQALDTFLDAARNSFEDSCMKQEAFPGDEIAMARLHTDLRQRIRKWKRVAGWSEILKRLEINAAPPLANDRP
jgi:transposase-like protein